MTINLARPKIGHFVPVKSINIVKFIILHKYLTENWLFSGLKKPAGLSGFEDQALGRPGLRKIGQAGGLYRPGPWLVTSLTTTTCFLASLEMSFLTLGNFDFPLHILWEKSSVI